MKVYFKNTWLSPNATRYRKQNSYEIPDAWADKLPSTAEILEDDEPAEVVEQELREKKARKPRKRKAMPKKEADEVKKDIKL